MAMDQPRSSRGKSHDVKTSLVTRFSMGFAREVSPEERIWCETHFMAEEFLRAARALSQPPNQQNTAPIYVLYIHAIEMALKSYLLRHGFTKEQVTAYRHGLTRLLAEARGKGLIATDPDIDHIVAALKAATHLAAIRYDMPYRMPLASDIDDVAVALMEATRPATPMPGGDAGAS